jgi:xylulokinase
VALDPARTVVAWAWIRQHAAHLLTGGSSWLAITDYPLAAWTGTPFLTDNLAARSGAWSPWDTDWLPARVASTLGSTEVLPQVLAAGTVIGPIRSTALAPVLAPGAVAVNAGHDHPIGGWAVDRVAAGAVLDSMGTAEVVVRQVAAMPAQRPPGIDVSPGITQPGATLLGVHELARNVEWIRRTRPELSSEVDALLASPTRRTVPDEPVFDFGGQGGATPRWLAAADRMSAPDLALAAVFACARVAVPTIEQLRGWDGLAVGTRVLAAGGWSRSSGWLSLKQQALGAPLEPVPEPEVTAVGAALLAGASVGWTQDAGTALGLVPTGP